LTTIKRILAYSKIYRKYGLSLSLFNHNIKKSFFSIFHTLFLDELGRGGEGGEKERTSEISKVGG
jgi:hypothetical protein